MVMERDAHLYGLHWLTTPRRPRHDLAMLFGLIMSLGSVTPLAVSLKILSSCAVGSPWPSLTQHEILCEYCGTTAQTTKHPPINGSTSQTYLTEPMGATSSPAGRSPKSPQGQEQEAARNPQSDDMLQAADPNDSLDDDEFAAEEFDGLSSASTSIRSSVFGHSYENGRRVSRQLFPFHPGHSFPPTAVTTVMVLHLDR